MGAGFCHFFILLDGQGGLHLQGGDNLFLPAS